MFLRVLNVHWARRIIFSWKILFFVFSRRKDQNKSSNQDLVLRPNVFLFFDTRRAYLDSIDRRNPMNIKALVDEKERNRSLMKPLVMINISSKWWWDSMEKNHDNWSRSFGHVWKRQMNLFEQYLKTSENRQLANLLFDMTHLTELSVGDRAEKKKKKTFQFSS